MTDCIPICTVCVIGVTQMIKNMLGDGNITTVNTKHIKGWLWSIITIVVSVGVVCIYEMLPSIIIECILVLSAASLFYDTIYKSFEKFIKGKFIKEEINE